MIYLGSALKVLSDAVLGPRYQDNINVPVKFFDHSWASNERLVEYPFIHRQIGSIGQSQLRILDFGCSRSVLPLELASQGHSVTGVDLRAYLFRHPRFEFVQQDLLAVDFEELFDVVTCVSTFEHVGLGTYERNPRAEMLPAVRSRLAEVLRTGGKLIITVPVGEEHEDEFLRSFDVAGFVEGFGDVGFVKESEELFIRSEFRYWKSADREEIKGVSNRPEDRGATGVNGVGCFVFTKAG